MDKKLKVGLVGMGRGSAYGRMFATSPYTEITAICDLNERQLAKRNEEFRLDDKHIFTNYDDFVNDGLDIVVIGTPMPCHAEQTIKAIENGCHVLCEVTVASTLKGCEDIFNCVKSHPKQKYMMAENCNYMGFAKEWQNIALAGRLGNIYYAEADYVHEIRTLIIDAITGTEKWRIDRAPLHYCSHSLGPILQMMPDDYIVSCTASGDKATIINHEGDGFIDMQVALFKTKNGTTIKVLRSSVATRKPPACFYSVYGTKGYLETGRESYENIGYKYIEGEDTEVQRIEISASDKNAPEEARLGGHGTSEYYLARDFIDSVINDTPTPIDITRALDMSVPGLIAHEAAMEGNVWKEIPLFWR